MLQRNLNKVALAGNDFIYSYARLLEQIDYYSLKPVGKSGQKVLIFSENLPEWIFTLYASWQDKVTVIPVDHMSGADELANIISDSDELE